MARQPFLPGHRGKTWGIGITADAAPDSLKYLIGEVAISWSHVENHLALTMGALLGVENTASVAVFTELRNNRSRRDALNAAAVATLADDDLLLTYLALMNLHRQLDGQRNDVIHGMWGVSVDLADAVLWKSIQDNAVAHIKDYHSHRPDHIDPDFDRELNHQRKLMVYPLAEIAHLSENITELATLLRNFHAHLRYRGEPAGDAALRQLEASSLLQTEVAQVRRLGDGSHSLSSP